MKNILKTTVFIGLFVASACKFDDTVNPNEISVSGADVNLIMNAIQLDFADFYYSASTAVDPLVRHNAMTAGFRYQTANQPQFNDALWQQAYQNVLVNSETLVQLAGPKNLTTHVAVAKILEAYTYMTLVDIFGDVPQSEALQAPAGNFNPKADGGAAVYAKALSLLDEARVELAKTGTAAGGALTRDIYYNGSRASWNALANTLELKLQLNLGTPAALTRIGVLKGLPLVYSSNSTTTAPATPTFGTSVATDPLSFIYKYGTATVPNSRHPLYNQYYNPTKGAAGGYIANFFLNECYQAAPSATYPGVLTPLGGVEDPRWRYYFYRQVGSIGQAYAVDPKSVGCTPAAPPNHYVAAGTIFCVFDPGFYGRDHGDASGTPPNGPVITCAGVYPAGGRFDNTSTGNASYAASTQRGDGANGAGISPIFMYWFTNFMLAEYYLRIGDVANARLEIDRGVVNSIITVKAWAAAKGASNTIQSAATQANLITAYRANVLSKFDAAASNTGVNSKLDVVGRELYVSAWGNGIEAYNSYRRTSSPRYLQPMLQLNPGPWLRSQVYPANYVNLNQNASQKPADVVVKVFWDTNPETLN